MSDLMSYAQVQWAHASAQRALPRPGRFVPRKRAGDRTSVEPGAATREAAAAPPIREEMITPATSSAVRGLNDAANRFDASARNIADFAAAPGDTDLASDIVDGELLAPTAYTANAKVLSTQAEMTKALLDIKA